MICCGYKHFAPTERTAKCKSFQMFPEESQMALTSRRLLIAILLALLVFIFGCLKRQSPQSFVSTQSGSSIDGRARININTASAGELEKLPGIGKGLAGRIIEQREKYGPFRKPEHLIIVRGISDKRFRSLQDLITVE